MNTTNTVARVTWQYRDETFLTKKLRFPYIAPNMVYFLSCMNFHFRKYAIIAFISKVTGVH